VHRRDVLRVLLVVVGACLGAPTMRAWARGGRAASPVLSARDAHLADLGARFVAEDAETARSLVAGVAGWRGSRSRGGHSEARRVRAALLGVRAREHDLARGDVLSVDGWMLTRSEVAYCVYLHVVRHAQVAAA